MTVWRSKSFLFLVLGGSLDARARGFHEAWDHFQSHQKNYIQELDKISAVQKKLWGDPSQRRMARSAEKFKVKGEDLSLRSRVEWKTRGVDEIEGQKIAISLREYVRITDPEDLKLLLNLDLEKFKKRMFRISFEEFKNEKARLQRLFASLHSSQRQALKGSEWWTWIALPSREMKRIEFTGFQQDQSALMMAVALYEYERTFNADLSFAAILDIRYILNGELESRAYLSDFDQLMEEFFLARLWVADAKSLKMYLQDFKDPRHRAHRLRLSQKWLRKSLDDSRRLAISEKLATQILNDKIYLGQDISAEEWLELSHLRIGLGMTDAAFASLEKYRELNGDDLEWQRSQGLAYEQKSLKEPEPQRDQTLSWAQEHYRQALNGGGLLSRHRDELLKNYATILVKRKFLLEATEIWEQLFRAGSENSIRRQALLSWIQLLFQMSDFEKDSKLSQEYFSKAVSLSGFFAASRDSQPVLKSLIAQTRYLRKKLKLEKDPVLSASLFELETLERRYRNAAKN